MVSHDRHFLDAICTLSARKEAGKFTEGVILSNRIKAAGGQVTREVGPVKGGTTVIAFVTDPDGYKIELIQRGDDAGTGQGLR